MGEYTAVGENWAEKPASNSYCPSGLEYLLQVDQLLIKQTIEMVEVLTGFETQNKYKILNSMGQQVYFAAEESDRCTRQCCGPLRSFEMTILDNNSREVAR